MNWPREIRTAIVAGVVSVAVAIGIDLTGLLDYQLWEIAASLPCGAAAFLLVRVLQEKVGSA